MGSAGQIIAVVVLGVVALVGLAIFGALSGVAYDMGVDTGSEGLEYPETGSSSEVYSAPGDPESLKVKASQGYGVGFTGDSYVDGGVSNQWVQNGWTICSTQFLAAEANEKATYTAFAYNNATILLQYDDGEWRGIHYVGDETAEVSVPVSNPEDFSSVCLSWDHESDELTIAEGDTGSAEVGQLTAENPNRSVSNNWVGVIDEVRVIEEPSDPIEEYAESPVAGLDEPHAGRYMFSEGEGNTTRVYYSDQNADLRGATWTDGVESPELEEGVDYNLDTDPLAITPIAGGALDNSPVIFVEWGDGGLSESHLEVISGFNNAIRFIPVIMLVMLAAVTVSVAQRMR